MANANTLDLSGVTFDIDGDSLVTALMPHIINALNTNPTFLKQIASATQTAMLQYARKNSSVFGGFAGSTRSGKSTGTNQTNGIAR